jgi:hypothetical protein
MNYQAFIASNFAGGTFFTAFFHSDGEARFTFSIACAP